MGQWQGPSDHEVSLIVISHNTRDRLRECLHCAIAECARLPTGLAAEVLVVDLGSSDGSAEMVGSEFAGGPIAVRLLHGEVDRGFANANNLAIAASRGRYIVLLDSGALLHAGALRKATLHMDADSKVAMGGGRILRRDGGRQPSARAFPTLWRDALAVSGLSARFPDSRFLGDPDQVRTNAEQPAAVDWIPATFCILRRATLETIGLFDPTLFVDHERMDWCRRANSAGFPIRYWPDMAVTQAGDEFAQPHSLKLADAGTEVVLWRMRSTLICYRRHHGHQARLAYWLEKGVYALRQQRHRNSSDPARRERAEEARLLLGLMRQAWDETKGGRVSAPNPR